MERFSVTNSVVVALGIAQAMLAPTLILAPLIYASLMIINAVFFHILPMIRGSGRFSPGVVTAIVLFYLFQLLSGFVQCTMASLIPLRLSRLLWEALC